MFNAVHIVFENEHLLQRDKKDFESLFQLLTYTQIVHYHVGLEFNASENELILVDESDTIMFNTPHKFA